MVDASTNVTVLDNLWRMTLSAGTCCVASGLCFCGTFLAVEYPACALQIWICRVLCRTCMLTMMGWAQATTVVESYEGFSSSSVER